jgi:Ulp1 family protease
LTEKKLNDEVINFEANRLSLLVRNSGFWVTSSHFYSKLAESAPFGTPQGTTPGYSFDVKRWTRRQKIDITQLKAVLIPLHVKPNHWAVIIIDLERKCINYFDSSCAPISTIKASLCEVNVLNSSNDAFGKYGTVMRNCA